MALNPTVSPHTDFDPESDAKAIREACKGFGTDEDTIIEILTHRTNEQRQQIAQQFKTMYGKDLIDVLKSELKGNFEDVILALMTPYIEFQAKQLRKAISGLGTDEGTIVEILSIHNNEDVIKIAQEYEGLYQQSLEADIRGDSSGTVKRILVSLSTGGRDESDEVDPEKALNDAQSLLRAGELIAGTDESTFNAILCQRNRKQLRLIFDEYEKMTGHSFEKCLENEFSGTSLKTLLDLVHCIRDPIDYLTTRLYESMSGFGTDDQTLIRLIVSRSEIDLNSIKERFLEKYEKSLNDFVSGDASGDYKKCLLSIIN